MPSRQLHFDLITSACSVLHMSDNYLLCASTVGFNKAIADSTLAARLLQTGILGALFQPSNIPNTGITVSSVETFNYSDSFPEASHILSLSSMKR